MTVCWLILRKLELKSFVLKRLRLRSSPRPGRSGQKVRTGTPCLPSDSQGCTSVDDHPPSDPLAAYGLIDRPQGMLVKFHVNLGFSVVVLPASSLVVRSKTITTDSIAYFLSPSRSLAALASSIRRHDLRMSNLYIKFNICGLRRLAICKVRGFGFRARGLLCLVFN